MLGLVEPNPKEHCT